MATLISLRRRFSENLFQLLMMLRLWRKELVYNKVLLKSMMRQRLLITSILPNEIRKTSVYPLPPYFVARCPHLKKVKERAATPKPAQPAQTQVCGNLLDRCTPFFQGKLDTSTNQTSELTRLRSKKRRNLLAKARKFILKARKREVKPRDKPKARARAVEEARVKDCRNLFSNASAIFARDYTRNKSLPRQWNI